MAQAQRLRRQASFTIPSSTTGSTLKLHISEPELKSENLSLETWAASHILASQLHHLGPSITFPPADPNVLPILELGAGTGMVGIAAALLWERDVVLTDLAPLVPALTANIALNPPSNANTKMLAGTLDWTSPTRLLISSTLQPQTSAQVIFAADTIYSSEHPELLCNVILRWLARNRDARFIMAYPLRMCYIEEIREMWERLEEGGLVALKEGRADAEEELFNDERLVEWSVWGWKDL